MNIKSCANCKWVGCKNYGYERTICLAYIKDESKFKGESK